MTLDWLYGKPYDDKLGYVRTRSLTFDHDGVRDLLSECQKYIPDATLLLHPASPLMGPSAVTTIAPGELEDLNDSEITRLIIGPANAVGHYVDLRAFVEPSVTWPPNQDGARQVVDLMLSIGEPRVRWLPRQLTPLIVPGLLAAAWLWFVLASEPSLSLAVLLGAVGATAIYGYLKVPAPSPPPGEWIPLFKGHRIRRMSRKEVWTQRSNTRANLKLAAVTLPVGALLGIIGTVITSTIVKK